MFHSARLKLTGWYLIIIMLISMMFSLVIYHVLINEVDRFEHAQRYRIERRLQEGELTLPDMRYRRLIPPVLINPELLDETKQRILAMLIAVNSIILLLSGVLGYILAGRTLHPIKDMMDEQNRFVSDASHELKTPLTSLKSAFEVFLRNQHRTLKEADTLVTESIHETDKLQSLSESMLQLAQYQTPNEDTQKTNLSLSRVINEALRKVDPIAQRKKIILENQAQDTKIAGNMYGLIDLFVILLDNAIKYSKVKSKVLISTEKHDKFIKIHIQDFGLGIAEKDVPHIFERFYRAEIARSKSNHAGYGLGLAIAKKIVDTHKGLIRVQSQVEIGTTFSIQLPLN